MSNDQSREILQNILDCLKRQESMKDHSRDDRALNRRRDSFSQICAMYAVIVRIFKLLPVSV